MMENLKGNRKHVAIVSLLIISILLIRAFPIFSYQFIDEESMLNVLVMQEAIANHGNFAPNYYVTPPSQKYAESWNLIELAVVPYMLLGGVLSLMQVMYVIKTIFIIISALLVFSLTKRVTGSNVSGYIALLFFAVSSVATFTQSLNHWTGDSFTPVLLLLSVFFLFRAVDNKSRIKTSFFAYLILSVVSVFLAYTIWNGGIYAVAAWIFAIVSLAIFNYTKNAMKTFKILAGLAVAGWIFVLATGLVNFNLFFSNLQITSTGSTLSTFTGVLPPYYGVYNIDALDELAGFIAFTVLVLIGMIGTLLTEKNEKRLEALIVIAFLFLIAFPFTLTGGRFLSLTVMESCILIGASWKFFQKEEDGSPWQNVTKHKLAYLLILTGVLLYFTISQIMFSQKPSPNIPQYQSMLAWISNTTNVNATFLTSVEDGGYIEYYAHRTVFMDTYGGLNLTRLNGWAPFLYTSRCNFTYLKLLKPNYLIIDRTWYTLNGTNLWLFANYGVINCSKVQMTNVYQTTNLKVFKLSYNKSS